VRDVDPEAVDAAPQPEAQDVVHRRLDLWLVPVEVGLLGQERVQVPLARDLVARPRGPLIAEVRDPPVRRLVAAAPDVPRPPRVVAARARLLKPRMAVGGVVGDVVQQDAQAEVVRRGDERVGVLERAEQRVYAGVVGDVVAEVGHRRAVDRRQPQRLDAEVAHVLEVLDDAAQVADPVTVGVGERARVDLVDDAGAPPRRGGHRPIVAAAA
jgi:hypothetical protein